jgi:hypothetical protein
MARELNVRARAVLVPAFLALAVMALAVLAPAVLAPAAMASVWCGDNGLIRFSFAGGDTLTETLNVGETYPGLTVVTVSAWLTGVDPVARDGDAFLRVGGVELKLAVTGAEAKVTATEFAEKKAVNVSPEPGLLAVGFSPGARLVDGKVLLVRWTVQFQGQPRNVRFGLDPSQLRSCAGMPGCPEAGPLALYLGAGSANQLDCIFGAGYVPAWLNPDGEPDRTPVTGKASWREVGVFQAR